MKGTCPSCQEVAEEWRDVEKAFICADCQIVFIEESGLILVSDVSCDMCEHFTGFYVYDWDDSEGKIVHSCELAVQSGKNRLCKHFKKDLKEYEVWHGQTRIQW